MNMQNALAALGAKETLSTKEVQARLGAPANTDSAGAGSHDIATAPRPERQVTLG